MDSIRLSTKDALRSYSDEFCGFDSPPTPIKGDLSHRYKQQDPKSKEQSNDEKEAVPKYTLSLTTIAESENLAFGSVHKIWSMLRILRQRKEKLTK
jgi:hypothetical protein